jgi:hypothetical protein
MLVQVRLRVGLAAARQLAAKLGPLTGWRLDLLSSLLPLQRQIQQLLPPTDLDSSMHGQITQGQ